MSSLHHALARYGITPSALESLLAAKVDKNVQVYDLTDHGVEANSDDDQTENIQTAFAEGLSSGFRKFLLPSGDYTVSIAEGAALFSLTNESDISIDASGAKIINDVLYTGNSFPSVFYLSGCNNIQISLGSYVGHTLSNPTADIGIKGAVVLRILSGTTGVKAKLKAQWCRYVVQTGGYSDETLGNCSNLDLDVTGENVGYPLALYYASVVKARVYANNVDRAAYLAGIDGLDIDVKFKNLISGGDTSVLITDAKTGTGTSQGCSNGTIRVRDIGSTTMPVSAMAAGISLSRVDPGTKYQNLNINVHVVSTNTVAHRMGGFRISSGATQVPGAPYSFDWEPTIYLRNIKVSGIIDRSAQTSSTASVGDIYVNTLASGSHFATVSNLSFEDLVMTTGVVSPINCRITVPGLSDKVVLNRVSSPSYDWVVASNSTGEVVFQHCLAKSVQTDGTLSSAFINSTIGSINTLLTGAVTNLNSTTNNTGALLKSKQITLTLSGSTTTWSNAIPAGAMVVGMSGIVTETITGATGWKVGVAADDARFVSTSTLTAGTPFTPSSQAATETSPRNYLSTTSITVKTLSGTFSGGKVRLVLYYYEFPTPTL